MPRAKNAAGAPLEELRAVGLRRPGAHTKGPPGVKPATEPAGELPVLAFENARAWERWLEEHHEGSKGLWLRIAKKSSNIASLTYDEALELALCFGWIDGQKKRGDETSWLQKFTPRGKRSLWSAINVGKVERLLAEGRLRPAGLRAAQAAKADGRWDAAYAPQSRAEVPEDLRAALRGNAEAAAFFEELDGANRYAILFRVAAAKKAETRRARVRKLVEMLARGETLHPRPGRKA